MQLRHLAFLLVSLLLVWASYSDVKTQRLPKIATYSLLTTAAVWLGVNGQWWELAFFAAATLLSVKGKIDYVVLLAGVGVMAIRSFDPTAVYFVILVLVARFLVSSRVFGGGDAQILSGIAVFAATLTFIFILAGVYVSIVIVLSLKKFGISGSVKRVPVVVKNFVRRSAGADLERIKTPWSAIATVSALIYFWIVPGVAW